MLRCRTGIVVILVAAFLALPFAVDRCVVVCAHARAAEASAAPACHHSSSPGPAMSREPNHCSQDHDGIPVVSAASAPSDRHLIAAVTFAPPLAASTTCLASGEFCHSGTAPPSRQSSINDRFAALRI